MFFKYNNCPHCFAPTDGGLRCAQCGYAFNGASEQPVEALPPFSNLYDRYLIGHVLGRGGFGITYVALDTKHNRRCAIKEFFPKEFAMRTPGRDTVTTRSSSGASQIFQHAKERFLEEARLVYQLRENPDIVRLFNYFSENNTSYMVMEYLDGQDLWKNVKYSGGRMDLRETAQMLLHCCDALGYVHARGFLHRDISPDNIFVLSEGCSRRRRSSRYVLIDFGAARNYIGTTTHSVLLKPGYSAPEAYSESGHKGPWTDVYSLAASAYTALTGKIVVDATFRLRGTRQYTLHELGIGIPKAFSDVIEAGMEPDYRCRPQSAIVFKQQLLTAMRQF